MLRFRICSVNLDRVIQIYVYNQMHTLFIVVFLMSKHCCGHRALIFCVGGETGSHDLQEQRINTSNLGYQSMPLKVHPSFTLKYYQILVILHNLYLWSIKSYISFITLFAVFKRPFSPTLKYLYLELWLLILSYWYHYT